jgi:hypothetical protein
MLNIARLFQTILDYFGLFKTMLHNFIYAILFLTILDYAQIC